MKRKSFLAITIILLLLTAVSGCSDSNTEEDVQLDSTSVIDIQDASFVLSDKLKEYMDSQGLENLALVTVLCHSWAGTYTEVSVKRLEDIQDKDLDSFLVFEANEYTIYVESGIEAMKETVTIDLETRFSGNRFTVEGINRFPS